MTGCLLNHLAYKASDGLALISWAAAGGVERALLDARRRVGVNCIVGVQGCGISSAHAGTQLMMHARLQ